jgi:Flp pilus assembly CpaF family ATPase
MPANAATTERLDSKLRRELGTTVLDTMSDPRTEDVVLNQNGWIWAKRVGTPFERVAKIEASQANAAIGTVAYLRGTVANHDRPILETELPLDGSRFTGILPPVTSAPVFAIRLRSRVVFRLEDYEKAGILTERGDVDNHRVSRERFIDSVKGMTHGQIIRAAVRARKNILVAGATGAGKTTLLNAALAYLAEAQPADRVVLIEDTVELQCAMENTVELRTVGAGPGRVTMLDCLAATLRLRPTRIIVGEVRDGAAHALLKAWNTGHPGGLATVHANSAAQAMIRLQSLAGEATVSPQQELIAGAVDLVVFIDEDESLGRKIREVCVVAGYDPREGHYRLEYV